LAVVDVILQDRSSRVETKVDGLSVHRLRLLGRVHVARVVVDSLSLSGTIETVPVRDTRQHNRGTRGKPPTPTRTVNI